MSNDYKIKKSKRVGESYCTAIVTDVETGEQLAEYHLEVGRETNGIAALRRAIKRHLRKPNATLRNYGW